MNGIHKKDTCETDSILIGIILAGDELSDKALNQHA